MVKWFYSIALLLLISLPVKSVCGNSYIDSLKQVERNTRNDSLRIDALSKLAIAYSDSAYTVCISYWKEALDLAAKHKYRSQMAHIHHQIGFVLFNQGEFNSALHEYKNSLLVHEYIDNQLGIGQLHNDIGLIYKTWGKYELALESFLKGLRVFETINDQQGIGMIANNIGQLYYFREEYQNAILYFSKYLDINQVLRRSRAIAGASNNIAAAYMGLKNHTLALQYYEKALTIYDSIGLQIGVAILSDNIGMLHAQTDNYSTALKYHFDALDIFEKLKSFSRQAETLSNIGYSLFKTGEYVRAVDYLLKGIQSAKKYEQREVEKDILLNLTNVYEANNQPKKALFFYKTYVQLKDSLLNYETKENLSALEIRYESEKKSRELSYLQDKIVHQSHFKIILVSLIIITLLLMTLLIIDNHIKKRKIRKLEQRKRFIYNTLNQSAANLLDTNKCNHNFQLRVIPFNRDAEDGYSSDVLVFYTDQKIIVLSIYILNNNINLSLLKRFLYNEFSCCFDITKSSTANQLVVFFNTKLLYFRDLFEVREKDLVHSYMILESNNSRASIWGKNGLTWAVTDNMVFRAQENVDITLSESIQHVTLYHLLFSLDIGNLSELDEIISKTIENTKNATIDQKAEVLNSAYEIWSLSRSLTDREIIVMVDISGSKTFTLNVIG